MYFSTAVIAAFAATYVSASPLVVRGNTCGAAPASSNTNYQPISQPSGTQTSAACQLQCEANSSCKSFCFGLVDNTVQCKLYSCAASVVPAQSSTNLVVYDKACSAVPSVVPTSSNPTGKKVDNSQYNTSSGSKTSGQEAQESKKAGASKTSGQKATESKQAQNSGSNTSEQKAQESKQAETNSNNYGSKKETEQSSKQTPQKQASSTAKTCGTKPSASTSNQPISAPSVASEDACKASCQGNSSCKSFTCGKVDNKLVCKLYSVAAAQVPAPSNAAQKSALKAYDVGCSI